MAPLGVQAVDPDRPNRSTPVEVVESLDRFRAGRLFDSKSGAMLKDQVIVIKGDRITAAGAADRRFSR